MLEIHSRSVFASVAALLIGSIPACTSKSDGATARDSASAKTPSTAPGSDTPAASSNSITPASATAAAAAATGSTRAPNELGRIPVAEYHLISDHDALYSRERNHFRRDLQEIYARGYRPVTISQILDRKIDLPRGLSPIVFVFDDASPSQFSYIERNGKLEIDPQSGLGIWLDFRKTHPDWANAAVFCLLPGGAAGHAFFGEKGIDGQKTEWRFPKVRYLHDQGFELCNHTLWHANLGKYSDAVVQEQIARGQLAIDSAVPGFKVRTFALPLGVWPKNRALAKQGSWTDPKKGTVVRYDNEAILEVSGGPTRSPYDPKFNPLSITRVEAVGADPVRTLDQLNKNGTGYVSDGNPATVGKPATPPPPAK
jgi:peptidoglycan/xylan/chitin deacetylase (PgdA/CDA1 family)